MLESDPAVRQRYTELVVETWLPPLRAMMELFMTHVGWLSCYVLVCNTVCSHAIRIETAWQMHLNDGTTVERLEALMSKPFGMT